MRGRAIDPVGLNFPVAGSYNSAEATNVVSVPPPTIRTRPSDSRVAVWPVRTWAIDPVGLNPAGPGVEVGAGVGVEAGVEVVASEVAAAVADVVADADVAAGVAPCDGAVPTAAEQPANTKTASRPPTRRPFARRNATKRGCLPRRERNPLGSDICSRLPVEVRGAISRTPMHGAGRSYIRPHSYQVFPRYVAAGDVQARRRLRGKGVVELARQTANRPAGRDPVLAGGAAEDRSEAEVVYAGRCIG
jgi:hypothetical protein